MNANVRGKSESAVSEARFGPSDLELRILVPPSGTELIADPLAHFVVDVGGRPRQPRCHSLDRVHAV
jgi:hypothetical protein